MKKGKGIEHRAAKVSLATGLSTFLSIVFQLISVPVCLMFWGKETYGNWLALFAAFMLLRSLDTGYVAYVGNKLNSLYHQDKQALRQHLSSAVIGIGLIGALQLLLASSTFVFHPMADMLGLGSGVADGFSDKFGLLLLVISWILTGSYFGIVHRLLIPAGMMFQAAWWSMLFQTSQFVAIMLASLLSLDMLQTSFLFAISQMVIYLSSVIYIKHKLPDYYPWWKNPDFRTGFRDLSQSMMLTISNLIQQGATNGIVLLIALLGGPISVPIFTTIRTLTNLWNTVSNVFTTPLLPDLVRFHVKNEGEKIISMIKAHWVLTGAIVNMGVLLIYPLLPFIYGYWTGHNIALNNGLLATLLSSVVVTNAGSAMAMHLNGINSLRVILVTSVVRGVLGLGCGALFYDKLGLVSFGLGVLIGELIVLLINLRVFVKVELTKIGAELSLAAFFPATIGIVSVMLFLLGDGFGWFLFIWSWPISFLGAIIAIVLGWKGLDSDVKSRLVGLFLNRFFKIQ
ncbi:MAG TPA: hypothetical protein VIO87_08135 [Methylotenera sp.]